MEMTSCLLLGFEASKAFLPLNELFLAVFMILVQSLTSNGVSALVIVVYEHVIATVLLSFLAFFLETWKVSAAFISSRIWRLSFQQCTDFFSFSYKQSLIRKINNRHKINLPIFFLNKWIKFYKQFHNTIKSSKPMFLKVNFCHLECKRNRC